MAALESAQTEAWFPNSAGRKKYNGTVRQFLEQLDSNASTVAAATMVLWYSKVEDYLNVRLENSRSCTWGPLADTLSRPRLRECEFPLRFGTLLRADFCRHVRNLVIHDAKSIPVSVDAPTVVKWKREQCDHAVFFGWPSSDIRRDVHEAARYVVGEVTSHMQAAATQGKTLSPGFFYALFSFTNFDSLAFEIEEALMPRHLGSFPVIRRQQRHVRRLQMIVGPATPESAEAPPTRVKGA